MAAVTSPTARTRRAREARAVSGGRRVDVALDYEAAQALDALCRRWDCTATEAAGRAIRAAALPPAAPAPPPPGAARTP